MAKKNFGTLPKIFLSLIKKMNKSTSLISVLQGGSIEY